MKKVEIPDGATNGDMIKAMFPNVECGKDELGNVFVVSDAQLGYIVLRESWWNAPYKGGCNLSEKPTGSESKSRGCGICHYNDGVAHTECVLCGKAESEDKE